MSTFYKQCRLKKGFTEQIAWIPEQFAVLGKKVKLKDDDRIWIIDFVSSARLSEENVLERSRDYRFQRSASDI